MNEPPENLEEYEVTLSNTCYFKITVEAENEEDAIDMALDIVGQDEDNYIDSYDGLEFDNIR